MYSKISEDTYRKLIDKLVRIPYVTGAHATRAIFGDGIEVAFQHRYMGQAGRVLSGGRLATRRQTFLPLAWRSIHGSVRTLDFR